MMKARELAFKVLMDVEENKSYADMALKKYLDKFRLDSRDRALVTELVYGVIERKNTLDYVIVSLAKKGTKPDLRVLNLLRMGIYQIMYLDKIPPRAACDEAVELTKKYCGIGPSKFVNGIIRSYLRNGVKFPDENLQPVEYLSLKYSYPEWMVERFLKDYDYDFVKSFLEASNQKPDVSIRVNTLKTDVDGLTTALKGQGIEVKKGKYAREALYVYGIRGIDKLDLYKNGLFQVQGESSMMVSHLLNPEPGEFIVDVCSAPGGKATHIAQLMENKGIILARDLYEHKLALIQKNCERLGIKIIKTQLYDARELDQHTINKADRVLVDAPCTGYGVIRKKPDIKWSRKPEDEKELVSIQHQILNNAARYVKSGGLVVYSTCTITYEENMGQVERFLQENKDFELESTTSFYPHIHGLDGFFISCLRRK